MPQHVMIVFQNIKIFCHNWTITWRFRGFVLFFEPVPQPGFKNRRLQRIIFGAGTYFGEPLQYSAFGFYFRPSQILDLSQLAHFSWTSPLIRDCLYFGPSTKAFFS
jgi:hypothetical protein